mgnify:FL=1
MVIINTLLILCLLGSNCYGAWDLYLALRRKNPQAHYSKMITRRFSDMYIIIPALNEENTIKETVNRILKSIASLKKISINITAVFIDDDSDDQTGNILKEFQANQHIHIVSRKLPKARKGKGIALNHALHWINSQHPNPDKTIIGVIDSDSEPTGRLLASVLWAFEHSHYGLIQTGVFISNCQSFLTIMQAFEFGVINLISQVLRCDWGSAIASGNGQFMTLRMTNDVKWRGALLDDLDFSINGLLRGYQGGFLPQTLIPQEGVTSYRAFLKQRTRWCQGGMQCLLKYGKTIFLCKLIRTRLKVDIFVFLFAPFIALFLFLGSLISLPILLEHLIMYPLNTFLVLSVFLTINFLISATIVNAGLRSNNRKLRILLQKNILQVVFGNLFYLWAMAPVPYIAFYRLLRGQNEWVKTAHHGGAVS